MRPHAYTTDVITALLASVDVPIVQYHAVFSGLQPGIDDEYALVSDRGADQSSWHAKGDFYNMTATSSTCVSTLTLRVELC